MSSKVHVIKDAAISNFCYHACQVYEQVKGEKIPASFWRLQPGCEGGEAELSLVINGVEFPAVEVIRKMLSVTEESLREEVALRLQADAQCLGMKIQRLGSSLAEELIWKVRAEFPEVRLDGDKDG